MKPLFQRQQRMARGHLHREMRSAPHHLGFSIPGAGDWWSRDGSSPPHCSLCQTLRGLGFLHFYFFSLKLLLKSWRGAGSTGTWLSTARRDLTAWTVVHCVIHLGLLFSSNKFKIGGNPNEGSRVVFLALALRKQFPLLASSKQK